MQLLHQKSIFGEISHLTTNTPHVPTQPPCAAINGVLTPDATCQWGENHLFHVCIHSCSYC